MNNLVENIYFKRVSRLKKKRFVFIFILLTILFSVHVHSLYFNFIPVTLLPYEKSTEIYEHLRIAFEKIFFELMVWPLTVLGIVAAMIYNSWIIQKLLKIIEQEKSSK